MKTSYKILLLFIFTVSMQAEYRLGVDYVLIDNPLPVKRDGVVEVTESFGMAVEHVIHLNLQLMPGLQNRMMT